MRIKKTLIIFLSAIVILLTSYYIISYLKNIALPTTIKEILIDSISKETDKKTTIDKVDFKPFKGVTIEGLKVYDGDTAMFEAGKISFNFLSMPFLKKRIVIPSLNIDEVKLVIKNDSKTEKWNTSDMPLFNKHRGTIISKKYPLIIHRINLKNGNIHFTDNMYSPPASKNIRNINAKVTAGTNQLSFKVTSLIEQLQKNAPLSIEGTHPYHKGATTLALESSGVELGGFSSYLGTAPIFRMDTLMDINGDLTFELGKSLGLFLKVGIEDEKLIIKGNVENFQDPVISLDVTSDLALKNIEPLLKELLSEEMAPGFAVDGGAHLKLTYDDTLTDSKEPQFYSEVTLKDAAINTSLLAREVSSINGILNISNDYLATDNLNYSYMDTDYILSGSVQDFMNLEADIDIKSDEMSVLISFTASDNNAKIEKADITYNKSSFSFTGDIYELNEPNLNLYGTLDFYLEDLVLLFPEKFDYLKKLNVKGKCTGDLFLGGKTKTPESIEIGLKLKSDETMFGKFPLKDADLKVVTKDKTSKLTADLCGGPLEITLDGEPNREETPYKLTGHLRGMLLEKLAPYMDLKDSGIYGKLDSSVEYTGTFGNSATIKGEGWIHAKEANLGPLPIFIPVVNHIVNFLEKTVSGYEKIKLKEATGIFKIADQKVSTDDFILWGDEASMLCKGTIGFDGALDFRVENNFVEGLLDNKTDMGKTLSAALTAMGSFISETHITGTLSEPKYEFKALPFKNILKGKMKDVFKNILR